MDNDTINGKPIELLSYNEESKSYYFNKEPLTIILNQEHLKDCNISVISIVGTFREGKSFLLSFFIRYLNAVCLNKTDDWVKDDNNPLTGFDFRGGYERHTVGIWIWSKIFVIEHNGKKIGIMLMDSQGVHDNKTTSKDNMTIFSMSALISSVLILNVKNKIQERDLQYLELVCEYGKIATQNKHEKPFQKLLLLIRDWTYPFEAEFGFTGGEKVLNDILKITPDQNEELSKVRRHIISSFRDICGFLMPHPGKCVEITQKFEGKISDIEKDFIDQLKNLIANIFEPQNLIIKELNNEGIPAKNLVEYIETFWNIFQADTMPTALSIFEATAHFNHATAYSEAMNYYSSTIITKLNLDSEIPETKQTIDVHRELAKEALRILETKAVMGDDEMHNNFIRNLSSELQELLMIRLVEDEEKRLIQRAIKEQELNSEINHMKISLEEKDKQFVLLKKMNEEQKEHFDKNCNKMNIEIQKLEEKSEMLQREIKQISDSKTNIIEEHKTELKKLNTLLHQEQENLMRAKHGKDLIDIEKVNLTKQLQTIETQTQKVQKLSDERYHKLLETESNLKELQTKASQLEAAFRVKEQSETSKAEIIKKQEQDIQYLKQTTKESNNENRRLNQELDDKKKNLEAKEEKINELQFQKNQDFTELQLRKQTVESITANANKLAEENMNLKCSVIKNESKIHVLKEKLFENKCNELKVEHEKKITMLESKKDEVEAVKNAQSNSNIKIMKLVHDQQIKQIEDQGILRGMINGIARLKLF